jgi:uncharacterized protein YhaN
VRFERLELIAFGKFTGQTLDFRGHSAGLHIVYGDNEAGKSTTLRAIRGLLFGVPLQSSDTFLHAAKDIRIGADLTRDSERISVVRRKGRINTLLTPAGEALPDSALDPFLQGVDAAQFDSMFGLNHESLREGAQALLALEGKLGATLFEAGFGTAHLRQLLERFREQADELFTLRGRSKRLNVEVAKVRKARDQVLATATSPQTYLDLRAQLQELQAQHKAIQDARQAQNQRKSEIELELRLLPLVAQWRAYREQRRGLGELPPLPLDAEQQAQLVLRQLGTAEAEREQATREVLRVEAELRRVVVDTRFERVSPNRFEELVDRLGSARKAQADLPKRRAEHSAAEDDIRRILIHLGYPPDPSLVEGYRLTKDEEVQVRRLTRERTQYDTRTRSLEGKIKQLETSVQNLKRELAKAPEETNTRPLDNALVRAQKYAELELQLDRYKLELAALERRWASQWDELRSSLRHVGRTSGAAASSWDELWGDQSPIAPETVVEFAQQADALRLATEHFQAETFGLKEREVELLHRVAEFERDAALPTEEAWTTLRAARDGAIDELARAVVAPAGATDTSKGGRKPSKLETVRAAPEILNSVKSHVAASDDYAVRLMRQADRVAELRSRRAALAEVSERLALREQRQATFAADQAALERRWAALWAPTSFTVAAPRQMMVVLGRVAELRAAEQARRELLDQVRRLERELATVVSDLSQEMTAVGEAGRYLWESLTQFVGRLEAVLLERRVKNEQRRELERRLTLEREQLEQAQRELTESKEESRTLRSEWPRLTKRLGVSKDAGPEELLAASDSLTDLFRKVEEARSLERRIAGISRDAEALESDVKAIAIQVYDPVPEGGVLELALRLIEDHRRNAAATKEQRRLSAECDERRRALEHANFQVTAAEQALARLLRVAHAPDAEALLVVIADVTRARELTRLGDEEERKIIAQGEGRGLSELVALCEGQQSTALHVEAAKLQEELAALEGRWEESTSERVALEQRLSQLGEGAAKAAEELESEVASLQATVRRYLRLRVATTVLESQIERYREANQGPVLGRARELFPRLTLGAYSGLVVGYSEGDAPVLLCTSADGREVAVEGLSDGTRDQLYLSLRLATLAQYFQTNAKMPWVLDDVLVHFDDARATAALQVLSEFASEAQVLFFTHHTRTVELAKRHIAPELVTFHELGATLRP